MYRVQAKSGCPWNVNPLLPNNFSKWLRPERLGQSVFYGPVYYGMLNTNVDIGDQIQDWQTVSTAFVTSSRGWWTTDVIAVCEPYHWPDVLHLGNHADVTHRLQRMAVLKSSFEV
jgi:hypothetical protein